MSKEFPKRYKFEAIEEKCLQKWKTEETYKFTLTEEDTHENIFSIDTPPPFTSGNLHMGHILNHAWIDFMARFRRLQGKKVYLPQGFDCHGLPTELKVQAEMERLNKDKNDRELFLQYCHDWTDKYISNMKNQFEHLGYSTDWEYSYKTMEDTYKKLVQTSLLEYYNREMLYRAKHPVHWCPKCETSLAKQEVGYIEIQGKIWELKLPIHERDGEYVTIATTRPEMMEACIAVLVHPTDDRYQDLSAARIDIPFTGRDVPVFMDHAVDPNFGTGVVYCCTYGDETDLMWKLKYDLPEYQVIGPDGRMTKNSKFAGLTTKEAQKAITKELESMGLLVSEKPFPHRVIVHTERSSCLTPIEYLAVPQWFIKVKDFTEEIKNDGLSLNWKPDLSRNLVDWCDSLTWDWVVSRQRVFGTPIPFWYCANMDCDYVIQPTADELPFDPMKKAPPTTKCPKCGGKIIGEKDVCDCWVDSSITPLRISQWKIDENFFNKVYPTTNRPQGYEIIRTWLFYTLYRSKQLTGKVPFSETMINGMVAGPDGRKMSKSFGNIVSPDEILPFYGTDAVRQWAAMGTLGTDYPFKYEYVMTKNPKQKVKTETINQELKKIAQGKITQEQFDNKYRKSSEMLVANTKFLTKVWNAYRLMWYQSQDITLNDFDLMPVKEMTPIEQYILSEFNEVIGKIHDSWDQYKWKEGYVEFRSFFWNVVCDNYLEAEKYRFNSEDAQIKEKSVKLALNLFSNLLKVISPIIPFIAEELYQTLFQAVEKQKSVHHSLWPEPYQGMNEEQIQLGKYQLDLISQIRNGKSQAKIALNKELEQVDAYLPSDVISIVKKDLAPILETLKITKLDLKDLETFDASKLPTDVQHVEDEISKWKMVIYSQTE